MNHNHDYAVGSFLMDARLDAFNIITITTFSPIPIDSIFIITNLSTNAIIHYQTIPLSTNENHAENVTTRFELLLSEDLSISHSFLVEHHSGSAAQLRLGNIYSTPAFHEYFYYPGNDLGATYTKASTFFRVWAPAASAAQLELSYDQIKMQIHPMKKDINGTWICEIKKDINGIFYNYLITHAHPSTVTDPYAKAVGVNGTWGAVVDLNSPEANPPGWEEDLYHRGMVINPVDAIIYELHVRDFSSHFSSGMAHKGKFLAFTETDTHTNEGKKTGIAHLKELGITHVHLLPIFDFGSLDEASAEPGFNWGYDPLNYNVPEGTYATDARTPYSRIKECKQLIQSLHNNGIGVIMDVVYNHTGRFHDSNLNLAVPGYYYRMNESGSFSNGSGCGNETASERLMVRKFITDSVIYWAREYHIDGFRFDLMGLHDIETMNGIRKELNKIDPRIMMYGEGWTGGDFALPHHEAALKHNMHLLDERIAAFSDDIRDGIKGSVFNAAEPGWVSGDFSRKEQVKFGITAAVNGWAKSPTQAVTYASAHDNFTLWDKLKLSAPSASEEELLAMNRLTAAIVFTSQGIPFIHAGEEIARSKNGDGNSYKSPDSVNQIHWDTKTTYRGLFDYYQGLIALRKETSAFRMRTAEEIKERITFLESEDEILAYIADDVLVAFNADKNDRELKLPDDGKWAVYVDGNRAGTSALYTFEGDTLLLKGCSAYVCKRDDSLLY